MRWTSLFALAVLTAGCGSEPAAKVAPDPRAAEREVRAAISAFYADASAGRETACDRLTNAYRRELGSNCTAEIAHATDGVSRRVQPMLRMRVLRVAVHGDRATATLQPKRWAGEDPPPIKLVHFGGRWLIDGNGAFESSNYAECVLALDEGIDENTLARVHVTDATMREFLDRVCGQLADAGTRITDHAAGRAATADVLRKMAAEGKLRPPG